MKTLIVYFSLEGNTDYAANRIAAGIGADLLRLQPKKAYRDKGLMKMVHGGRSAIAGDAPELQDYDADLSVYDRVVIGFPVWAGRFAPPIRTFVQENAEELKGKRLVAFACQSGSGAENALGKLEELIGLHLESIDIFIDPKKKQSEKTDARIDAFIETLGLQNDY